MMAKFQGTLGYVDVVETSRGVFENVSEERPCNGDILRDNRRWESSTEHLNDDITINNRFSILADEYMYSRFNSIRYLVWNGIKWKITAIEVEKPRLIINVRGVWNGN